MVVPGEPMPAIDRAAAEVAALARDGRAHEHRYGPTFTQLAALGEHPGFTLAALARSDAHGHREIYTHAKLCIVDGAWPTLGSANLVDLSLDRDHTELNAAWWGRAHCLPLLLQLVAEHTDIVAEGDLDALDRFAARARAGRDSLLRGDPLPAAATPSIPPPTAAARRSPGAREPIALRNARSDIVSATCSFRHCRFDMSLSPFIGPGARPRPRLTAVCPAGRRPEQPGQAGVELGEFEVAVVVQGLGLETGRGGDGPAEGGSVGSRANVITVSTRRRAARRTRSRGPRKP
ncbi:hypothetical protein SAMN02745121_03993 [Nannocystis exedens]|uniref:PLD phosphodiesterase domain-containing protein n=1 Tax=Nannocystis exedens TaxID=54 RepID=A0A1I1ZVX9_9BACT|nr:putative phospholipase D/transphosphatidylase [Nannocystis exedens]SFE35786.1 hypothetical protein SAMN02745121_03993 [Nannocystis exedens]